VSWLLSEFEKLKSWVDQAEVTHFASRLVVFPSNRVCSSKPGYGNSVVHAHCELECAWPAGSERATCSLDRRAEG
jgi:hypothetical protein